MTQPSTSLRVKDDKIRFATALGWKHVGWSSDFANPIMNDLQGCRTWYLRELPDPTDANTVREAWKTLTPQEKKAVVDKLRQKWEIPMVQFTISEILIMAFDEEPPTLAELICEVRKQ